MGTLAFSAIFIALSASITAKGSATYQYIKGKLWSLASSDFCTNVSTDSQRCAGVILSKPEHKYNLTKAELSFFAMLLNCVKVAGEICLFSANNWIVQALIFSSLLVNNSCKSCSDSPFVTWSVHKALSLRLTSGLLVKMVFKPSCTLGFAPLSCKIVRAWRTYHSFLFR